MENEMKLNFSKIEAEHLTDQPCPTGPSELPYLIFKDWLTLHAEVERLNLIISGKTFFSEVDAALAKGRLEGAEAMKKEVENLIKTEEELEGPAPEEVRQKASTISYEENLRCAIRATKKSLIERLESLCPASVLSHLKEGKG